VTLITGLALFAMGVRPVAIAASERPFAEGGDGSAFVSSGQLESPIALRFGGEEPVAPGPEDPQPERYLSALMASTPAGETSTQIAGPERHWSGLPLLGEQARRAGYELPLPFGVGAIYNYVARDIEVTDVRVGVNGAPLASVSDVANFRARSTVNAAVVKADAWVFPFLDVYVLLGYIDNVSDTNIAVTVPNPSPLSGSRQFTIRTKTELQGFIGGGGLSLVGGYRQFFAMADVNYSATDLGFDDRFRALIASARIGWNGMVGPVPLRLWAGGAYWNTKNTARATTEVPDVGTVRFETDQGPKQPWNALVGVSAALHRQVDLFAEYGSSPGDVTFVAAGVTIRF
jgi:hypothetical protein